MRRLWTRRSHIWIPNHSVHRDADNQDDWHQIIHICEPVKHNYKFNELGILGRTCFTNMTIYCFVSSIKKECQYYSGVTNIILDHLYDCKVIKESWRALKTLLSIWYQLQPVSITPMLSLVSLTEEKVLN